jgi:hypothetical protein
VNKNITRDKLKPDVYVSDGKVLRRIENVVDNTSYGIFSGNHVVHYSVFDKKRNCRDHFTVKLKSFMDWCRNKKAFISYIGDIFERGDDKYMIIEIDDTLITMRRKSDHDILVFNLSAFRLTFEYSQLVDRWF